MTIQFLTPFRFDLSWRLFVSMSHGLTNIRSSSSSSTSTSTFLLLCIPSTSISIAQNCDTAESHIGVQYFIRYYVYQQRRVVLHARVGCANDSAYAAYLFAQVAVNVVSERVLCVCRPKFISSPNTNVDTAKTLILILSHDNSCAHCVRCAPLMCECV